MMDTQADPLIEDFKLRKIIESLDEYRGSGTSLISLIMPPRTQISDVNAMLTKEHGTASNIKSRVTRQSVLSAITSTQQKLKLYNHLPPNGLIIYCGHVFGLEGGGEKKITLDFEPPKQIQSFKYICRNSFETDILAEMMGQYESYGYIIVSGKGCLYGLLNGQTKIVKSSFSTDLPKKHNKGGQSSVRFARLRIEAIHNYIRKIAEGATINFITNDRPNVRGLIIAGIAELKIELVESKLFDPRLRAVILNVLDIAYGGENGFNQAIELSGDLLNASKLVEQNNVISTFFTLIAQESSSTTLNYCFGQRDILYCLKIGAVEKLIVWDELKEKTNDGVLFVDWIVDNYKTFGTKLYIIRDCTSQTSQFCKGFGGLGAILRYGVTFEEEEIVDVKNTNDVDFL
jgi:peptide chain release factor subunit 1